MSAAKTLLKSHNLRLTECREEILRAFQEDESAKSHSDLENEFGEQFDRVT
jgi:Fur family ferric uptake transcriptional regulator